MRVYVIEITRRDALCSASGLVSVARLNQFWNFLFVSLMSISGMFVFSVMCMGFFTSSFSSVPSTLLRANEIVLSDDESEMEDEMDTQSEQDFSNEPSAGIVWTANP